MNTTTCIHALPVSASPNPVGNRVLGAALRMGLSVLNALLQKQRTGPAPAAAAPTLHELPDYVQRDIDGMGYSTPRASMGEARAQFEHTQAMAKYRYY